MEGQYIQSWGKLGFALVALLTQSGTGLAVAILAAVGIRLATLWFAIVCGLLAVLGLGLRPATMSVAEPAAGPAQLGRHR